MYELRNRVFFRIPIESIMASANSISTTTSVFTRLYQVSNAIVLTDTEKFVRRNIVVHLVENASINCTLLDLLECVINDCDSPTTIVNLESRLIEVESGSKDRFSLLDFRTMFDERNGMICKISCAHCQGGGSMRMGKL